METITRAKLLNRSHLTAKKLNEVLDTLIQGERVIQLSIGEEGKKKSQAFRLSNFK